MGEWCCVVHLVDFDSVFFVSVCGERKRWFELVSFFLVVLEGEKEWRHKELFRYLCHAQYAG